MPETRASTSQTASHVIEIEDKPVDSSSSKGAARAPKRSWVWQHFVESQDGTVVCHVSRKDGSLCLQKMRKDKTGSTGNYSDHLLRIHHLQNPNSAKLKQGQLTLTNYANKTATGTKMTPKVEMNPETLKNAIVYFLSDCDLPFALVEKKSFRELLQLLNCNTSTFGQTCISNHLARTFILTSEIIKLNFISNQKYLSFTEDAWTSPNVTAFMAVTVHFINDDFELKNLTLAVPHVQGPHTGENFAELFEGVLQRFECSNKLHTITADNAGTNNTMAWKLSSLIPSFEPSQHLLGCVAHVINLAAKAGLLFLGGDEADQSGQPLSTSAMDLSFITTEADGTGVNLKTVLKRVHGLSVHIRSSPQRRQRFKEIVKALQLDKYDKKHACLVLDVETRWNSTFDMFQRAVQLRLSCDQYCKNNKEANQFSLNENEWNQDANLMQLLEPLSRATNILCSSLYPSLNSALPVYLILVKHLKTVQHGLYDQGQLIQPAIHIIEKIDGYLWKALEKPFYVAAMILDPRFKMQFWKNHADFIKEDYSLSIQDIDQTFHQLAKCQP
ncbi:hypothetical protein PCASD_14163 [Puccinia coronata f. sp. avenae]|uniref:BED-type domain-containing protein n=1 Tax=Puccinia coronata f. sp. avenae TaxID=200324 RepID=A0A2N5TEL3_9BASI|nr:hypothetical protein PCASD_14163 [Puccinia coronata f. sp. avenae]